MARAQTASKVWKQLLCDPRGTLHENGQLALADLAKYCRFSEAPTRHDATGKVDVEATMEAIGMHKLYRRILALIAIRDEVSAIRIAQTQWPQADNEDDL